MSYDTRGRIFYWQFPERVVTDDAGPNIGWSPLGVVRSLSELRLMGREIGLVFCLSAGCRMLWFHRTKLFVLGLKDEGVGEKIRPRKIP